MGLVRKEEQNMLNANIDPISALEDAIFELEHATDLYRTDDMAAVIKQVIEESLRPARLVLQKREEVIKESSSTLADNLFDMANKMNKMLAADVRARGI